MNNIGLVSIITPCYNASSTISQTIDSVLKQTYGNWEMLIIDDCSTDESADIIKKYCKEDARIKYFKTENSTGSPSIPRNIGIDNAKGQYIAFLDADDLWLPEKLEKQMCFIQKEDYEFIYSNYEKINPEGKRNNRIIKMPLHSTYWDILETCSIPCLTALIKKETIGEIRFKQIFKEDYAFWLDILRNRIIAHNCNETLALYREQYNSRSSNKFAMIKNQWNILTKIEGVKTFVAYYCMIKFLYKGIIKYIK